MNWDQIQGKWKQVKGSVREEWGNLTDDDLEMIAGSREKFVGKLQERYGFVKEEAQKRADDFIKNLKESGSMAQEGRGATPPPASPGHHRGSQQHAGHR